MLKYHYYKLMENQILSYTVYNHTKTFLVTGDGERGERYRRKHRGEDCSVLRHAA